MKKEELIASAYNAMQKAYAPYSNFQVGAALLSTNGTIYTGCNIENGSYGATICAERTAIFKAISEGVTQFEAIAIVCSEARMAYPCGICLQVMSEFMPDGQVVLSDSHVIEEYTVRELLPSAFSLS